MIQYLMYQTFRVGSSINLEQPNFPEQKLDESLIMRTFWDVKSDLNDDWECDVWSYEIRLRRIVARTNPDTDHDSPSRHLMSGESSWGRKFANIFFFVRRAWASHRDHQGIRFMHANEVTHYYEWETKLEPIRSVWKSYRNKRACVCEGEKLAARPRINFLV